MATTADAGARYDEGYMPAANGEHIFTRRWLPAEGQPRAVAVLSHGLGEHGEFYLPLARYLLSRGLAVYAHDHRGFGRSGGRRGYIARYEQYVDDLRSVVERARSEFPGVPVVLVGHSMGGTIALLFSERHPDLITHAVYSAPALLIKRSLPPLQRATIPLLARLWPAYTTTGTIDPTVLTRDPEMQREVREDAWRHAHVTARLFVELFVRGPRDALRDAKELRTPFLIVHGTADPLVWPASSRLVYERATAPGRAIRLYPGLLHEPFREVEREQVFADVGAWLEERGVL